MDRRNLLKVAGGTLLAGASGAYALRILTTTSASSSAEGSPSVGKKWGMVIDLTKCRSDCTDCVEACRKENNVALHGDPTLDVHWIRKVKIRKKPDHEAGGGAATGGHAPAEEKSVIILCNHCDKPPCAQVCPVQATYKRHDGIVIVDHHRCIGCRYCMIACPYNARQFNFQDGKWLEGREERPKRSHGVAESCTLCAHRLDVIGPDGKHGVPACVEHCQAGALTVGDLNDPHSEISQLLAEHSVRRLKEDLGTEPKVHYIGL